MMIKITKKCSMGCSHCLNNSIACEEHMDEDVLKDSVKFAKKHSELLCIISGGEPLEHPKFEKMLFYVLENMPYMLITLTTNGMLLDDHKDFINFICKRYINIDIQVTNDSRYYPKQLNKNSIVFNPMYKDKIVFVNKIERIYPQGRALTNNLDWESKGCKCFNIRAINTQLKPDKIKDITDVILGKLLSCTPHIDIYGNIKLGESDLCPVCSNIYKTEKEILNDITNFNCHNCSFINKKVLPEGHRKLIGE